MPNWCSNCISFDGTEKAMRTLKKDVSMIKNDSCIFTALTDVKSEWNYKVWITEFGTKWSVQMDDEIMDTIKKFDYFNCETAWSPCIEFVQKVCKKYGVTASIEYSEPGMDFAGIVEIDVNGDVASHEEMTCMEMNYNNDYSYFFDIFTDDVIAGVYESEDEIRNIFTYVTDEELEEMLKKYNENIPAKN